MSITGLLAGSGHVPVIFLERAREKGDKEFITVAIEPYDRKLKELSDDLYSLPMGKIASCLGIFSSKKVSRVFTLGNIDVKQYLNTKNFDSHTESFLREVKDSSDSSFLALFRKKLKEYGIPIADPRRYFAREFTKEGILTSRLPSNEEEANIKYGFQILNKLGKIDTFQTVVIKKKRLCAVETVEGTNETILRAGNLAGKGTVIVKMANLAMADELFHIPTVGYGTLKSMAKVGATALAIEAEKVYVLGKDKVIEEANKHAITIKAVKVGN